MGVIIANDILTDCTYLLIDPPVDTTIAANIGTGLQTVTPASMKWIFVGALLIIGRGTGAEEVVTVAAVTSTTFDATFAQAHTGPTGVVGAVFSRGQADGTQQPLFTQAEMLGYLATGQNDFLLKLRPTYKRATQVLGAATTVFTQPTDCIRIERLAVGGLEIPDSSQAYIDNMEPSWPGATAQASPDQWFQDKVDTENFGISPQLSAPVTAELYYAQKQPATPVLNSTFIVPDIMTPFLKFYVMFKAFSKDGEQRDMDRAALFYNMYNMGIRISKKFIEGVGLGEGTQQNAAT